MTQELSFSQENAIDLTNLFKRFAPLILVLGGATIDFLLVGKRPMALAGLFYLFGALMMSLAGLASSSSVFYIALGLLIVGQALLRPALYCQLVSFFESENDPRFPLSFMILYWFMNIGAFLAPLACGLVVNRIGFNAGFFLAAMAAGGIIVVSKGFLNQPANDSVQFRNRMLILTLIALTAVAFAADYAENIIGQIETLDLNSSIGNVAVMLPSIIASIILPFLWIAVRNKFPNISIKAYVPIFFSIAIVSSLVLYGLNLGNGTTKFALVIVSTAFFSLAELLAFSSILRNTPSTHRATVAGGFLTFTHLLS